MGRGGEMDRIETDVLVVGSGLGATAAAKVLGESGYRVVLVPGIGRSLSPHIDGGVIERETVESAFGSGAPLGTPVRSKKTLQATGAASFEITNHRRLGELHRYRRSDLENWALARGKAAGAIYLDDFVEGQVLPNRDGSMTLTSERDSRRISSAVIALCEGADPRIALRVRLRPDYGPEDQLHFGRALLRGEPIDAVMHGAWRTGWGMPVDVALYPQDDGTLVSVVTRIENVMRASRSSKDALEDLLESPAFRTLAIEGDRGDAGMELVALRSRIRDVPFVHDRLVMGIDFSGVIDPRRLDRGEMTIRAGQHLAAHLVQQRLGLESWPAAATAYVRSAVGMLPAYHDDKNTGFLEEGPPGGPVRAVRRMAGLLRRR
jgi:flavin-dependent dehydrogenase